MSAWARTGARRTEPPGASNSRCSRARRTASGARGAHGVQRQGRRDDRGREGRSRHRISTEAPTRRRSGGFSPGIASFRGARGALPGQGLPPRATGVARRRVRPGCGTGRLPEGVQRTFPLPGPVKLLYLALSAGDESMPRYEAPRQVRSPRGVGGRGDWARAAPVRCCRRRWPACALHRPLR